MTSPGPRRSSTSRLTSNGNWSLPTTEVHQSLARLDRAIVVALGPEGLEEMGKGLRAVGGPLHDRAASLQRPVRLDRGRRHRDGRGPPPSRDEAADEETATDEEAEDQETEFSPFSDILNTGDVGTFLVDATDVDDATTYMALPEFQRALPRGVSLQWGWDSIPRGGRFYRELYVLEEDPFLTGDQLNDATANRDQQFNQPQVLFELNRRGGPRLPAPHGGQHRQPDRDRARQRGRQRARGPRPDRARAARSTWARPTCPRPQTWHWCCAPGRCPRR